MNVLDLEPIAAAIGYTATRKLAAWYPGRVLSVPTTVPEGHPLLLVIGKTAMTKLVTEFAGLRLRVPVEAEDSRYKTHRLVAEMLAAGATPEAVASCVGLTTRRVEVLRTELESEGWISYADGGRRSRGRPHGGSLGRPEFLGTGEVFAEPPGGLSGA